MQYHDSPRRTRNGTSRSGPRVLRRTARTVHYGKTGEEGHRSWDSDAAASEDPTYVLVNVEVGQFTDGSVHGPLHAEIDETDRLYWCNGGPNLTTNSRLIANVFKRGHNHGDVASEPMR